MTKSLIKYALLFIFIIVATYSFVDWKHGQKEKEITEKIEQKIAVADDFVQADLLGKGSKQQVYVTYSDPDNFHITIEVEENNQKVANIGFNVPGIKQASELRAIKLNESDSKEYIQWIQIAGAHHFESLFFELKEGQIELLFGADIENESWYMPFWTSRGKNILIKDIDGDGLKEVVEFADEYPPGTPKLDDMVTKNIMEDTFRDSGISEELIEEHWKIVSRENLGIGRGFRVVWNIYSFVDGENPYLKKLNSEEYTSMVSILLKDSPAFKGETTFSVDTEEGLYTLDPEISLADTISRDQLSQDSIDFNEFVRELWAGYYSEPYGSDGPGSKPNL